MVANAGSDEIWVALSDFYPDSVEPLRAEFDLLLPQRQIVVWQAPGPVAKLEPSSQWRMETGELVREAFIAGLKPDAVHVSSLFEGLTDDVLTSIGSFDSMLATAVTLYDLIPLVHREHYLADAMVEAWYERKLGHLRRAQLWLAISESSRREAIDRVGLPADWVVNISTAADRIRRRRAEPYNQALCIDPAICSLYRRYRSAEEYRGLDRRLCATAGSHPSQPSTGNRLLGHGRPDRPPEAACAATRPGCR
jgi:hypothetical protein